MRLTLTTVCVKVKLEAATLDIYIWGSETTNDHMLHSVLIAT